MALLEQVLSPAKFCSAYKPILWGYTSMRSPNVLPGESAIAIVQIKVADAADAATYGAPLEVGDVFVEHSAFSPGAITVGQAVLIAGTAGTYSGLYHVLKIITAAITVIDAEPLGFDSGGTISKFYEKYHLVALVTMRNLAATAPPVKRELVPDIDDVFYLDVGDIARRSFHDVFIKAFPGATVPTVADGAITQKYSIYVYEAYMVPDTSAVNQYTEFGKGLNVQSPQAVAVNSVQPYHHIDEVAGGGTTTDLLWEDDLAEYLVTSSTTLDLAKRFLTYAPKGVDPATMDFLPGQAQRIGVDEDAWLGYLWGGGVGEPLLLSITSYNADDVFIGAAAPIPFTSPVFSGLLPVGTRNLGASIHPSAHHYKLVILNVNEFPITEPFSFEVDRTCHKAPRRLHWRNPFGAVDSFTVAGPEGNETTVKRQIQSKPHMAVDLNTPVKKGDWQRRVIRTEILRKYRAQTHTLSLAHLRWLAYDLVETADVRTAIYLRDGEWSWTWVEMLGEGANMGTRHGRLDLQYAFGIDNRKQIS